MLTAEIDGRITHFYEWAGAGNYDCVKAGTTMQRGDPYISAVHFAYDHSSFYIRLDFHNKKAVDLLTELRFIVALNARESRVLELSACESGFEGGLTGSYQFALNDILELAVERSFMWPEKFGPLTFSVTLYDGDRKLETWPEHEPIQLTMPEKHKEMFWPS